MKNIGIKLVVNYESKTVERSLFNVKGEIEIYERFGFEQFIDRFANLKMFENVKTIEQALNESAKNGCQIILLQ